MLLNIKSPGELHSTVPVVYCKNFLPLLGSSITMLVSNGGTGKSFCSIRLALEFVKENPKKKAALWLTEDSEGENNSRYRRLVSEFDEPKDFFDERISFITSSPKRFTMLKDGNAITTPDFKEIKKELAEFGLIVLDPLLQFNGCDENSNSHAGVLMGALKDWSAIDDKVILLLHHVTVSADKNGSVNIKARGAGEWQNGCRCVYAVAYPVEKDVINKQSRNRVFEMIKDNGIGYKYFMKNGVKERVLTIFPEDVSVPEFKRRKSE